MSGQQLMQIADYIKSFSNPLRINILVTLTDHEKSVNEIVEATGAKQCYVSQQLQYLTRKALLSRRSQSHNVFYSIKNRNALELLELAKISLVTEDLN